MTNQSASVLTLLAVAGRAATPPVPPGPDGLDLVDLLGVNLHGARVLTVVSSELAQAIGSVVEYSPLIPGLAVQQCSTGASLLVVEQVALHGGAWAGTEQYVSARLVDELYEAEAHMRKRGGVVLWMDSDVDPAPAHARLVSAASGRFSDLDDYDPELDGAESELWMALRNYSSSTCERQRNYREC